MFYYFFNKKIPGTEIFRPGMGMVDKRAMAARASGVLTSLQQRQHAVWQRVGLGQHGRACLLQDLAARQLGRFRRKVGVLDART